MKNKLTENKLGQHTAEFMVLFLALAVVFVGTRLYLRRGVNAKLIQIQDQLNDAVKEEGVGGAPVSVAVHFKVTSLGGGKTYCQGDMIWSEEKLDLFMNGSCGNCIIEMVNCPSRCDWGSGMYSLTVIGEGKEKSRKFDIFTSCGTASGCMGITACQP